MSSAPQKFFLTTPIYYVNARPHIGHAYTTIVADVLARRHRLLGDETFFLTGTDEHGQKIERSAQAAGIPPQQFADQVSKSFSDLWARMGITHDKFIRTTDEAHKRGVQKLFADLHALGQIYLSSYTGQYSIGEEMFVEGPPGTIGPDGKPTETVTEENFFFRLGDYQLQLLDLIESDTLKITPEARKNEVLSFLRGNAVESQKNHVILSEAKDPCISPDAAQPTQAALPRTALGNHYVPGALKDLSVSRSSFTWGIPVPQPAASEAKEKHVVYVWLDALANYMTALGYGSDDDSLWQKFWPADLHLVGKEIIRFHCVYWPAFLLALRPPEIPAAEWNEKWLPKAVTAHGWLLFDDSKMSKSKGNIVRTETILDAFGSLCPQPKNHVILSEAKNPCISSDDAQSPPQVILSEGHPAPGMAEVEGPATPPAPASPLQVSATLGLSVGLPLTTEALKGRDFSPATPRPAEDPALAAEGMLKKHQDLFAADTLRYFLLREIPFGQDGSFSFDALVTRYNADLANGYGNLVSRTLKMISDFRAQLIPEGTPPQSLKRLFDSFLLGNDFGRDDLGSLLDDRDFSRYLEHVWGLIAAIDNEISSKAPWKAVKKTDEESRKSVDDVLYTAAESIRIITILLHPIMPYTTAAVWTKLGLDPAQLTTENGELTTLLTWGGLQPGTKLGPLSPIFPRADKKLIETMTQMEQDKNTPIGHANAAHDASTEPKSEFRETSLASESFNAPPVPADSTHPGAAPSTSAFAEPSPGLQVAGSVATTTERPGTPSHTEASSGIFAASSPQIAIDDFVKIDLRVAKIVVAERIPKADKLLRLEVDLGYETRQILSGIAEYYTPEELLGRRIVVIANLAPRKMRGLESHGMLLAASDGEHGKPILATFPEGVELPLGSRLK